MNIIKKIGIVVLMILITISCLNFTEARDGSEWKTDIQTMSNSGSDASGAQTSVSNVIGVIIGIARVIGMGIALIMLAVVAIKYMVAAPDEKANIKNRAVAYIVGATILFAATGILTIIQKFATNFNVG